MYRDEVAVDVIVADILPSAYNENNRKRGREMEGKVNVKYASPPIASAPSCRAPNIASPNAPNFSTEPRTKVPSQNLEQGPSTHTKYCANNHCKL